MNVAWDFFFVSCTELLLFFFSHEYIHYALYWPRFEEQEVPGSRSFFTEIIASISDIKFAKDGRYILSRDYMTLKVDFFFIYICLVFISQFKHTISIRTSLLFHSIYYLVLVDFLNYVACGSWSLNLSCTLQNLILCFYF